MTKPRIFPTLVDSYTYFLKSEMPEQDMIDRINRVETEPSEAMMKGSAMNDLVDHLLSGGSVEVDMVKKRGSAPVPAYKMVHTEGVMPKVFHFYKSVVDELVTSILTHGQPTMQVFSRADIDTSFGTVELYGYCDYLVRDTLIDLKTTSRYSFPKYADGFQHKCYLYTLIASGNDVRRFKYLITDTRAVYMEEYYWMDGFVDQMREQLDRLLQFIEDKRELIINNKVLGL